MSLGAVAAQGTRTIGVAIRGDSTSLSRELRKSAAEVQAYEKTTTASVSRWSSSWKLAAAGAVVAIAAVVAGLAAAGVSAVTFERNMRNVNSLLLLSNTELESLSARVLDVARTVPQSAETLAEGLYNIASSGFEGAEGLLVLEASAKAASAGMSTTATAAEAITAVLNAYGLSAASATDVSDVLFATVDKGVIEFDDLAQGLGNVIGMSSQAQVPISDVGSALATMTLTGVGAAEATTSLNRVIQSIIQPSTALSAVYEQLGYESGLAALQQKGLYGVLEDVRQVTNGNTEAYLALFPEIRAARGALALAANDGEVYARIQGQIGDATERSGATQTAFAEQMQSTSARWAMLMSSMRANTIEVGSEVLPIFNQIIDVATDLSNEAVPAMTRAWQMLSPYMQTIKDIGGDVWGILTAIYEATSPVAEAFLAVGGAVAGMGLDLLLSVLSGLTGFLNENRTLAVALAGVYLSRFLPSVTSVIKGVQQMTTSLRAHIAMQIAYQRTLATGALLNGQQVGAMTNMRLAGAAAMTTFRGLAASARVMAASFVASGGATAILTAAILGLVYVAKTAGNDAVDRINGIAGGINVQDLEAASTQIADLQSEFDKMNATRDDANVFRTDSILDYWFGGNAADKALVAAGDALADLNGQITNSIVNATALRDETGVAFEDIQRIAQSQNIDLTSAYGTEEAAAARDQIIAYLGDMEKQTGISTQQMAGDWQMSVEQIEAFSNAIQKATSDAASAFASATDVLGTWKPNIGVEEEADALERLADARAELSDLEKDAESSAKQLAAARERVADAEASLAEAQQRKAEGTLEAFYQNAITMGESFTSNLDKAVQMGLDPQVVAKLLQEGPKQAGPIVEQMVADTTGSLIQMVNEAESTLADINVRVVEQARLTAIAVNANTDELGKQLPQAMDISTRTAGGQSKEDIAKALGITDEDVQEIADNFGITLIQGISTTIVGSGVYKPEYAASLGLDSTAGYAAGTAYGQGFLAAMQAQLVGSLTPNIGRPSKAVKPLTYAAGTSSVLPGYTPGRDVHRFWSPTGGVIDLSGGEGIGRPEFVAAVGVARWNMLNAVARTGGVAAVRRMLSGQYMGAYAAGTASLSPQVVTVPVSSTNEHYAPITIGAVYAQDVADIERQAKARRRKQWGGRR